MKKPKAHIIHKGGAETILVAEDEEDVMELTKIVQNIVMLKLYRSKLESPLLGGDLGVGKSATCLHATHRQIHEIFNEISRPLFS